jgi:hypothetical protein
MNFNDQWIEIFAAGSHADNKGRNHTIDPAFLDTVVRNFNADTHHPPIVVGHPVDNSPAFGWTQELRRNGQKLEARFNDVDSAFENLVRDGRFKKRSASFYVDPATAPGGKAPTLRHVGFLGAEPPAVKGLRDISFTEGEALTFDFSEGDNTMETDDKAQQGLVNKILDGIKSLLPKKDDDPSKALASFSETDLNRKITDAVNAATASFTEQITTLKNENKSLRDSVDSQASRSTRAEIISFVEKLTLDKCPPAFRQMGVVEFMESLSAIPAERKVTVIEFSEKDGKKIETKTESTPLDWFKNFMESLPSFISFGEGFGSLRAMGTETATVIPPERMNDLRAKAGITVEKK